MDIPRLPSRSQRFRPYFIGFAVLALVIVSISLARVGPEVPSVASDRLVTDQVVRGDLIRTVGGPGKLLPEDQLLIPAPVSGRIQKQHAEAGSKVEKGAVLLVLSNPEVDLQLLEAERLLAEARMARQRVVTENNLAKLTSLRELTSLRRSGREAERQHQAMSALLANGLVSSLQATEATDQWQEFLEQIQLAEQLQSVTAAAFQDAFKGHDEEISRVAQVAAFHRRRVDSLTVRSAISGVVQDLFVEQGQWVSSGELLAKVFRPGNLKAELRVPEARAGEISPQQNAVIVIRGDSIDGVVRRVNPAALGGTVTVEIALTSELPTSARPDLNIEGRIETGRSADTLHLRRPASAIPDRRSWIYRMDGDGSAIRIPITFGAGSTERIEVVEGAAAGDLLIVSDLGSDIGEAPRLRIRN